MPLLVYDRILRPDGQLAYPMSGKPEAPWVAEVFGDAILVNGKLFPHLDVEPRQLSLSADERVEWTLLPFLPGIGSGGIGAGARSPGWPSSRSARSRDSCRPPFRPGVW